jgi:hypothetical protein
MTVIQFRSKHQPKYIFKVRTVGKYSGVKELDIHADSYAEMVKELPDNSIIVNSVRVKS